MLLDAILKKAFKKMLPQVVADIKGSNSDFGLINLKEGEIVLGVKATGQVNVRKKTSDFENIGNDFKELVPMDGEALKEIITSILIELGPDLTIVRLKSDALGSYEFTYKNTDL